MTRQGAPRDGAVAAKLILPATALAAIRRAAEAAWPQECCGLLLGYADGGGCAGRVTTAIAAANVAEGDRRRRFDIDPRTLFAAHRQARADGQRVMGHYHSHPGGAAVPSAEDAARSWEEGVFWLIVAVDGGRATDARAWLARQTASRQTASRQTATGQTASGLPAATDAFVPAVLEIE